MPTYTIRNKVTKEEKDVILSFSQREELLERGEWEQIHKSCASLVTQVGGTLSKAGNGWKDVLETIKKGSGRGNTINT